MANRLGPNIQAVASIIPGSDYYRIPPRGHIRQRSRRRGTLILRLDFEDMTPEEQEVYRSEFYQIVWKGEIDG